MEGSSSVSTDYQFSPNSSSENTLPVASTSNGQFEERSRDRKNISKRKHVEIREKVREKPYVTKKEPNVPEEDEDRYRESQDIQTFPLQSQAQVSLPHTAQTMATPATFPNYYYTTPDHFNTDPNQRPYPMMPQYGLYPVNPWVNPMEGMSPNNMALNPTPAIPVSNGIDMSGSSTMMSNMPPYVMNMSADAQLYGFMGGMGNICSFPYVNGSENLPIPVQKETINLETCVLYAPNANAPIPTLRPRPPGCRTVFVGGLPEKITEEIVRDAFKRYGEIVTIRMSKKNFCHIRFACERDVENALYLSAFRIKIDNKDEAAYSGRLHVDYAVARDDQYEYECARRAAEREARHKALGEQETKELNMPVVAIFSEVELGNLVEQFRNGVFSGVRTVKLWIERGEVNKRNSGMFFSLIQSLNSNVLKVRNDKKKSEEELKDAKSMLQQKMYEISLQLNEIEKVFTFAKYQKVWDHFTKAQRKNIELWKKQTSETKKANSEELIDERVEDEMEMSDGENTVSNNDQPQPSARTLALREEKEELRNRLAAKLQEVAKLKADRKEVVDSLTQNLQNVKQNLVKAEEELEKQTAIYASISGNAKNGSFSASESNSNVSTQVVHTTPYKTASGKFRFSERDARYTALISAFLSVHPHGAHIDYICSYLLKLDSSVVTRDLENWMRLFPAVFEEKSTGIGATLERKWTFLGYNTNF